jgi:hypothetical protein
MREIDKAIFDPGPPPPILKVEPYGCKLILSLDVEKEFSITNGFFKLNL